MIDAMLKMLNDDKITNERLTLSLTKSLRPRSSKPFHRYSATSLCCLHEFSRPWRKEQNILKTKLYMLQHCWLTGHKETPRHTSLTETDLLCEDGETLSQGEESGHGAGVMIPAAQRNTQTLLKPDANASSSWWGILLNTLTLGQVDCRSPSSWTGESCPAGRTRASSSCWTSSDCDHREKKKTLLGLLTLKIFSYVLFFSLLINNFVDKWEL